MCDLIIIKRIAKSLRPKRGMRFADSKNAVCADPEGLALMPVYSAKNIAMILGIYSIYGKPHYQAVSRIINDVIQIDPKHKEVVIMPCGDVRIKYDKYALLAVHDWINGANYPREVFVYGRNYNTVFKNKI